MKTEMQKRGALMADDARVRVQFEEEARLARDVLLRTLSAKRSF